MEGYFNTMKAMISQPMNNLTADYILSRRQNAMNTLKNFGYDIEDTFFTSDNYISDDTKFFSVAYLAKSIEAMSKCDAVYFCKGWEEARGCKIEHEVAKNYGLAIIYEE